MRHLGGQKMTWLLHILRGWQNQTLAMIYAPTTAFFCKAVHYIQVRRTGNSTVSYEIM